jgi:hypothetical protein
MSSRAIYRSHRTTVSSAGVSRLLSALLLLRR